MLFTLFSQSMNSSDVIQARWLALYVIGNVPNIISHKQRGLAICQ